MYAALIMLALDAAHGANGVIVDAAAVRGATSSAPVVARAELIDEVAATGSTDALVVEIRAALTDPTLEVVAREWLLDSGLAALRGLPPSAAARTLARELAGRPPLVYTQVEFEHGGHVVPLYDPGATARFALRHWVRIEARESAARALSTGSAHAVEDFLTLARASGPDAARSGILDAFGAADLAQLRLQRPAIVAALRAGLRADELALLLARRLRDAELYALTIGHADPAIALAAVLTAAHALDGPAACDILAAAADREPIASAALLQIGRLASSVPAAQQLLLERLSDPVSGESAAAALAGIDDPTLAARIGGSLRTTRDEAMRRRLALALKLNGGPGARDELAKLVSSKQGSAELRKEVAAWLAPAP
ncbi:MAG TPA: hypothetical protein VGA44_07345 [Steroidobacteraceae bacterium]